jgi:hypothetical protein
MIPFIPSVTCGYLRLFWMTDGIGQARIESVKALNRVLSIFNLFVVRERIELASTCTQLS